MEEKDGTFVLKDAFKNYGISQLMELCPCEENTILERFSPDMTIREIRNIKKDLSSTKPKTSEKQTTKTEVRQPRCRKMIFWYRSTRQSLLIQIKLFEFLSTTLSSKGTVSKLSRRMSPRTQAVSVERCIYLIAIPYYQKGQCYEEERNQCIRYHNPKGCQH